MLDVTLSRNYTDPAGTAVTLTQAKQASQVVNVTVENVDDEVVPPEDPVPVFISATITEDNVDEGGGMFHLVIVTQNAIGQRLTLSADEAMEWGLVNKIVDSKDLQNEVKKLGKPVVELDIFGNPI